MNKKELEAREEELVWEYFQHRTTGFFVEVGANDPKILSQTWHLEERGWRGVLVDPNPECAERLRQHRPNSRVVQAACSAPEKAGEAMFYFAVQSVHSGLAPQVIDPEVVIQRTEQVKVVTLDSILASAGNPKVDFVSIDVQGTELDVLRGFNLAKHQPGLVLLEDLVYHLQNHSYMRQHGYKLVRRTGLNNWYIPQSATYDGTPFGERVRLFRKIYLGTPWRRLKLELKRRQK